MIAMMLPESKFNDKPEIGENSVELIAGDKSRPPRDSSEIQMCLQSAAALLPLHGRASPEGKICIASSVPVRHASPAPGRCWRGTTVLMLDAGLELESGRAPVVR
ncbi:MAG: hypothetical protein ABSC01_03300 [Verrucomicrobiota bacterium]|jgi:hypothetical protein